MTEPPPSTYNAGDSRKHLYALTALDQLETRVWLMAFHDPASGSLIKDENVYCDGRPVTTTIGWGGGFATLVHSPDPNDETGVAAEELSEEVWPTGPGTTAVDEDDFFDTLDADRDDSVE